MIQQARHAEVIKRTIAVIGRLIEKGGKSINTVLFHVGLILLDFDAIRLKLGKILACVQLWYMNIAILGSDFSTEEKLRWYRSRRDLRYQVARYFWGIDGYFFVMIIIVSRVSSQLLVQEMYETIIIFGTNLQITGQQLAGLHVKTVN